MSIIKTLKTVLFTFLLLNVTQTFAQQVNFSGNWRYNKEKSDLSSFAGFAFPVQLQVKMTVDSLYISSIVNLSTDKTTSIIPFKYSLDGQKVEKIYPSEIKRVTSYQLSGDKKMIVKNAKTTKADVLIKTVDEIWTLSVDSKELIITLTEHDSNQKPYTVRGIFDIL